MENNYEQKPLYRFFNVIFIILYIFVMLCSALFGKLAYDSRKVISARVKCADGTDWNALKPKDIIWNDAALCGVCTKRDEKIMKYPDCEYDDPNYYSSHQIINKQYAWSWWIIFTPLTVFVIGFGIVDFIKLATIYIFSGEWAWYKSALLRVLLIFLEILFPKDNK